jgi:transcriptional regulator of met regulon
MSISNEEWNAGRTADTIEMRVLKILTDSKTPLNVSNIVYALGYNTAVKDLGSFLSGVAGYWVVQSALDTLVKERKIEARTIKQPIGEQVYYKAIAGKVLF